MSEFEYGLETAIKSEHLKNAPRGIGGSQAYTSSIGVASNHCNVDTTFSDLRDLFLLELLILGGYHLERSKSGGSFQGLTDSNSIEDSVISGIEGENCGIWNSKGVLLAVVLTRGLLLRTPISLQWSGYCTEPCPLF